jgi:hypothetical protein
MVHADELYILSSHVTDMSWSDMDSIQGLLAPTD